MVCDSRRVRTMLARRNLARCCERADWLSEAITPSSSDTDRSLPSELVQNAHAFGIAHRTQNGCQFGLFAFNVGKPRHGQFSPSRRRDPTGASVLHLGPEGL